MLYGNAVVGQSGGPTAAINATLSGVIRGALDSEYINTLYGMRNGVEGLLRGELVNLTERFGGESITELDTLETTPAAALGSCRKKLPSKGSADYDGVFSALLERFRENNIRYFFYIGGNDSMDTVAKLSEFSRVSGWEMRVIGVPKTIDNDLVITDHTPGFGSAAKYISVVMQEILRDTAVYTVKAVTIVEIMGRDAGWLTASAALGANDGLPTPDFIYLPERDFSDEKFLRDINSAFERHPNVVVAVSEGLKYADGRYVGEGAQSGAQDIFGHRYLAGTGKALEGLVKEKIGCKVRSVELNLPQRCASHIGSAQDIEESVSVGRAAVESAVGGVTCEMMTILRKGDNPYSYEICHSDVSKIANQVKTVPNNYINEDGNGVTDECISYLTPLISGEKYPKYRKGLPIFCKI